MPLYTPAFMAMALANLCSIASFSVFFLFPLFVANHGGSRVDIGIIMGAFTLSSVLCRPLISQMIDRIGRKKSFTSGALIMAVLPLAYLSFEGLLPSFYVPLLLVRVIHGVGIAICITAAFTYAADIIPRERLNEGIGMFGISGLTGMALGPILGEYAGRELGFSSLFLVAAGLAALGVLVHMPLPETYTHSSQKTQESFFSVLRTGKMTTVALVAFLFGVGLAGANNFVSPFAGERQIASVSLYFASYSAAAVLTRLTGGRLVDRVGEERIIPYALVMTGLGLLVLVFLGGEGILLFSGCMTGTGHGFLYPSLNALAIRDEPMELRGKLTGAYTGGIDAGVFMGSLGLGYIGEHAGFPTLFFSAGLALFLGFFLYTFQKRRKRF